MAALDGFEGFELNRREGIAFTAVPFAVGWAAAHTMTVLMLFMRLTGFVSIPGLVMCFLLLASLASGGWGWSGAILGFLAAVLNTYLNSVLSVPLGSAVGALIFVAAVVRVVRMRQRLRNRRAEYWGAFHKKMREMALELPRFRGQCSA